MGASSRRGFAGRRQSGGPYLTLVSASPLSIQATLSKQRRLDCVSASRFWWPLMSERTRAGQFARQVRFPPGACESSVPRLYRCMRGWRGQVPRQPGQVRKEAAVTSPTWVVVSLSPANAGQRNPCRRIDHGSHCIPPGGVVLSLWLTLADEFAEPA